MRIVKTVATFILVTSIVLTSCSREVGHDTIESSAGDVGSYEAAHSAAEAAIRDANAKGHAWTTTDALLTASRQASDNGELTRAIEFANEAKRHAELASAQADSEAKAWRDRVE